MNNYELEYLRSVIPSMDRWHRFRLHSALSHLLHSAPGETTA